MFCFGKVNYKTVGAKPEVDLIKSRCELCKNLVRICAGNGEVNLSVVGIEVELQRRIEKQMT